MTTETTTTFFNISNTTDAKKVEPDTLLNYLLSVVIFFLMIGVGMLVNFKMFRALFHCVMSDPEEEENQKKKTPWPTTENVGEGTTKKEGTSAGAAIAAAAQPDDDDDAAAANGAEQQQKEGVQDEEEASPKILMSTKSYRPLFACSIGVCCQLLLTPCIGVAVAHIFDMTVWERFGCLAVSCVPGGAISNPIAAISHGVVELSVTMTVISSCLCFGMTPLNLFWTSHAVGVPSSAVDFGALAIGFAGLGVPLIIGLLINRFASKKVKKVFGIISGVGTTLGIIAVVVVVLGGFSPGVTGGVVKSASWKVWVAASVVNFPIVSMSSYLFGKCAGFRPSVCRTLSIESLQNVGIAAGVLQLGLRHASADERTAAYSYSVIYSLAQYVWMALFVIGFRLHRKYNDANGIPEMDPEFDMGPNDHDEEGEDGGDGGATTGASTDDDDDSARRGVSAISLATAPTGGNGGGESDAVLGGGGGGGGYNTLAAPLANHHTT